MTGPDVRAVGATTLPEGRFPDVRQEFRIAVSEAAFDRAVDRGQQNLTCEVGGVLVGRVGRDAEGPFVLVETTIDALHAEEKGTELTFTHATWDHIHRELETKHAGLKIVGWYHTHPGFGVFLSDRDRFIHKSFFDLPFQIALVYDPKSREHGVFAWRDGEPVRWRRYFVGSREQVWDGSRGPSVAAADRRPAEALGSEGRGPEGETVTTAHGGAGEDPRESDRWSLGVGAAAVLLLGGLIGWWLGRGSASQASADVNALARAQAVQDVSRELNVQLLSLVRHATSDVPVRRELDEASAALEQGLKGAAEGTPLSKEALEQVRRAADTIGRLRATQEVALVSLSRLEQEAARLQPADARLMASMLSEQRAVLGQVCAELGAAARRGGDPARAERWLAIAVKVDPANREGHRRTVLGDPVK